MVSYKLKILDTNTTYSTIEVIPFISETLVLEVNLKKENDFGFLLSSMEDDVKKSLVGLKVNNKNFPEGTLIVGFEEDIIKFSTNPSKSIINAKLSVTVYQESDPVLYIKVSSSSLGDKTNFRVVLESLGSDPVKTATTQIVI